jgi:hypothetical protein
MHADFQCSYSDLIPDDFYEQHRLIIIHVSTYNYTIRDWKAGL